MNYEQKYKNALERARDLMTNQNPPAFDKHLIEMVFPELDESEDERIRKEIIDFLRLSHPQFVGKRDHEKWIAWLEKQNKQSYSNIPSRETILAIWELGNDWKELTNGSISTEYGTQLEYIQKHWQESEYYLKEKQGKQTQLDYEHADIPQKDFAPIDPKFKVGDWVVNNVCFPMQIASIKDGMYVFTKGDAMSVLFIDGNYHLWSINDAKDGDVLVSKDNRPFIFTGEFDVQDDNPTAYCGINSSDKFITGKGSHWTFKDGIKPATKEQCELLFSKMKEAGYEWDSEKKELKKIEPKKVNVNKVIEWINSDEVIEWLKNTIRETKEYFGEHNIYYNTQLALPYNSIEDLINDFKEDFGLC